MNPIDAVGAQAVAPDRSLGEVIASMIGAIASDIAHVMPPGDVASLKRLRPWDPGNAAFWRLLALHVSPRGVSNAFGATRNEAERCLAVLFSAMAHLKGQHSPKSALGRVLAEQDLSEARFLKLLRAEGPALLDNVRLVARFLATKAVPVDQTGLALLIASDGKEWAEDVRRKIARDYYSK